MSRIHFSGFNETATERQIEDIFINQGRIIFSDINLRKGSGSLEYEDEKNATKAIEQLNNSEQLGAKITVQLATKTYNPPIRQPHFRRYKEESRSGSYSSSRSRSRRSHRSRRRSNYRRSYNRYNNSPRARKEPSSRDKCFVCGKYGHWASQCKEGDGTGVSSGKCFRCGEKGHIARNCPNARKKSHYSSPSNSRSDSYSSRNSRKPRTRRKNHSSSQSQSSNNSSRSKSSNSK